MRRAAKRDKNERAIIDTWESMGAYVESVSGPGLADTLVHHDGRLYRCEVKGAKNGLTPKQVENFGRAYAVGVLTFVVRTTEDAKAVLTSACRAWVPSDGALAGAARKERAFRPGTDRARSLDELCSRDGCPTSRSPGMTDCTAHAAEVFAPPPDPYFMLPRVLMTRAELLADYPVKARRKP